MSRTVITPSPRRRTRSGPRQTVALAVLALIATACGPRITREEIIVANQQAGGGSVIGEATTGGDGSGDVGGATGSDGSSGTTGSEPGESTTGGETATSDSTGASDGSGTTTGASDTASSGSTDGTSGTSSSTSGPSTASSSSGSTGAVDPGNTQGVSDKPCAGQTTGGCIKIGYLVPLTGAAPVPTSWDEGANFYWDELNKKGGINGRKIQLFIEDTESSTTTAVQKARALATQERVFTIISLDRLEVQDAIARFLEQAQMPHIMIQSPANPPSSWVNTFTISIDHVRQGAAIADFMGNDLGAKNKGKKVAFVREQTNALKPGTDAWETKAAELGMDVVARETINPTQQEFSQTVLKLQQAEAEIVWLYMAPTPAATIIQNGFASSYTPTWFANSISWGFELMHAAAGPGMNGAYAFSPWVSLSSPRAAEFKKAWAAAKGNNPDDFALVGWGIGEVATSALQAAGQTLGHNTFRNAMKTLKTPARVWGPIDFTGGGSVGSSSVAIYKAEGNAWQTQGDFRRY